MQQTLEKIPPAIPLTMEAYRNAAFRARVVTRLHEGKAAGLSPEAVVATLAAEQRALAAAITDPATVTVAGEALLKAQASITTNPRYQSTPEQAHETMQQIMKRRAAEAEQFAAMLEQPEYIASLTKLSLEEAQAAVPALRDVKIQDTLNDLLHLENGAPQVIAHIDATAKGTMLEHDALAIVFDAHGTLHDTLMQRLATQLPTYDKEAIHAIASIWLADREAAAKLSSELSSNTGAAYLEAVRQSTEWHRKPQARASTAATAPLNTIASATATSTKSWSEIEKEKDAHKRAEDVAYTINHALSCGTTDVVLQPLIAAAFGVNVGCAHPDHAHDHDHGHSHEHTHAIVKPKITLKSFAHEAGHYLKGEIIGDFAAVPLTIGVQRFFPNFMHAIRTVCEPLFGWAFRGGANRTARHWAKEHGIASDAPETQAHAAEIYEHEISHLPQAVVWNMFAYPIGAIGQKLGGHEKEWGHIFKSKLVGAVISNGLLIGGRMVAPGAAQKWDTLTGDNIFAPVSKQVGKLFGVDEKTMEKASQKQRPPQGKAWAERVEEEPKADVAMGGSIH